LPRGPARYFALKAFGKNERAAGFIPAETRRDKPDGSPIVILSKRGVRDLLHPQLRSTFA
jgi:hypothetical protein